MDWSNLQDTFLNIVVFAFIGWLVWLYFEPSEIESENDDDRGAGRSPPGDSPG